MRMMRKTVKLIKKIQKNQRISKNTKGKQNLMLAFIKRRIIMYKEFGIKEDIIELSKKVEKDLMSIFKEV